VPSLEDELIHLFDSIGRLVCHQMPSRTLRIGGHQLPVCARCTGAYLGLYIGYLLLPMRRRDKCGPPNLWITLSMTVPIIVDFTTQLTGFRTSTNEVRLMTGLLFGVASAPWLVYLFPMIPTGRSLPIVHRLFPRRVELDDKNSWLSPKAFGLGLLLTTALFSGISLISGLDNPLFYWLLSPLIIVSVIWHIFLLPILVLTLSLAYLLKKARMRKSPNRNMKRFF